MSSWKHIIINDNLIETKTEKAVLIKMPHRSQYKGYVFWHPAKLVKHNYYSNGIRVAYTDDFTFRIKQYSNSRFNNKVIYEKEIGAEEIETAFENVSGCYYVNPHETHIPEQLEAVPQKAIKELLDDE